jgi:hypothetical protein
MQSSVVPSLYSYCTVVQYCSVELIEKLTLVGPSNILKYTAKAMVYDRFLRSVRPIFAAVIGLVWWFSVWST